MAVEVILGLPYLSSGPLTQSARQLQAQVLLSANSFSVWRDDGPAPKGYEVSRIEAQMRLARGELPPFKTKRPQRMRTWEGWNLRQLDHAVGLRLFLDSAGFWAQAAWGGFPWTVQQYIYGLCARYPFERFSSLDLCVEAEVAHDRDEVRERISKTIALNKECRIMSNDLGIADRLMHVIQGSTADDYLRCFDAMAGMIGDEAVIGVGSMCRRKSKGEDGIISIVDALDRRLPPGIRLHLFGLKSDGAESVAMLDHRVASIDSQAYGVRARRIANEKRAEDPNFSKSNAFVASIMENWWTGQVSRMARGKNAELQAGLPLPSPNEPRPQTVFDALILRARAEFNQLIEDGQLDHDQIIPDSWLLNSAQDWISDLPRGVSASDRYTGIHQLPEDIQDNWPIMVDEGMLHPSLQANPLPMKLAA